MCSFLPFSPRTPGVVRRWTVLLALAPAVSSQEWRQEPMFLGRGGHAAAFDPDRGVLVLFGGYYTTYATPDLGTVETDGRRWWQRQPALSPQARRHHAMCFDEVRRETILFGGYSSSGVQLNDTWAWNGTTWRSLLPATAPSVRVGHAMVWDPVRREAVLFGGADANRSLSDTWLWNGAAWRQAPPAPGPRGRMTHAMAFDEVRGRVVMHGGHDWGVYLGDTWEWDGTGWLQVGPPSAALAGHAMAFDRARGTVVMYGGHQPGALSRDLWEWLAVGVWSRVPASSVGGPGPRYLHALTGMNGRILFTGGASSIAAAGTELLDAWEWDGTSWQGALVQVIPDPRSAPGMVWDAARQRVVLFGGLGARWGPMNDLWEWDGAHWHARSPAATWPPARAFLQMTWDPVGRRTLVHGGQAGTQTLADTWSWDGTGWTQHGIALPRVAGAMAFDAARNRAVVFGGASNVQGPDIAATSEWDGTNWRLLQPAVEPPARRDTAMVWDARRARTVLFGGYTLALVTDDTWEWDGATWTQVITRTRPPARRGHALVFDGNAGRVLLHGGDQGSQGSQFGDVWAYDGVDWQRLSATGARATWHGAAFDAARDRLVVFGGDQSPAGPSRAQWEWVPDFLATPAPAPIGGSLGLHVRGVAFSAWLLALSLERAPGVPLLRNAYGEPRTLPLAADRLFGLSLGFGLYGVLDANGRGTSTLAIPPDPALAGLAVFTAGILVSPMGRLDITEEERASVAR